MTINSFRLYQEQSVVHICLDPFWECEKVYQTHCMVGWLYCTVLSKHNEWVWKEIRPGAHPSQHTLAMFYDILVSFWHRLLFSFYILVFFCSLYDLSGEKTQSQYSKLLINILDSVILKFSTETLGVKLPEIHY